MIFKSMVTKTFIRWSNIFTYCAFGILKSTIYWILLFLFFELLIFLYYYKFTFWHHFTPICISNYIIIIYICLKMLWILIIELNSLHLKKNYLNLKKINLNYNKINLNKSKSIIKNLSKLFKFHMVFIYNIINIIF